MFYRSLSPLEQAHIVEAFTFELGKVYEQAIKERELDRARQRRRGSVRPGRGRPRAARTEGDAGRADGLLSPALSQIVTTPGPVAGRKVGIIADAGSDLAGVNQLVKTLAKVGVTARGHRPRRGCAESRPADASRSNELC